MRAAAADTLIMLTRQLRKQLRLPLWIAIMVAAPLFWLLLYGQLFQHAIHLPGNRHGSYDAFLAPGLVVMTAFSWSLWGGMSIVRDIDRGLVDSLLSTPLRPIALILGNVLRWALVSICQAGLIMGVGIAVGVRVHGGALGWAVVFTAAALTAAGFAAVSNAIALTVRQEETLSAVLSFLALPLMFLSAALIDSRLMPRWMRGVVHYNPVNWGVSAARGVTETEPHWQAIATHLALISAFVAVGLAAATAAFAKYRRTL